MTSASRFLVVGMAILSVGEDGRLRPAPCAKVADKILINALLRYDFQPLPCAWRKLVDYDIHLDRQR